MEEKLNKQKFIKRVIIGAWITLALCFVIKLFGGNFFNIICENENFIAVCNYADNHLWLNYLISAVYCFISLYFFDLAILGEYKYKKWQFILVILTSLIGTFIKIISVTYGWVFDIWQFALLPILFLGKAFRSYWKVPFSVVLLLIFQIISMYVKDLKLLTLGDSILVGVIFSIDVLIMIILYYLYANFIKNKKES